jgi:hypothetical protein
MMALCGKREMAKRKRIPSAFRCNFPSLVEMIEEVHRHRSVSCADYAFPVAWLVILAISNVWSPLKLLAATPGSLIAYGPQPAIQLFS